ncbi:MAG: hypothetical protein IPM50_06815 [Acidobacteriota bacterium]|nr:MAG: hypothetical protein IPM50_06815 [Acidobacteriota bacterium]
MRAAHIAVFVLVIAAGQSLAQANKASVEPLFEFLRKHAAFTQEELSGLEDGKPVIRVLPERDKRETSVIGIVRVSPRTGLDLAGFRESIGQRANPSRSGGGPISVPPQVADLEIFRLDDKDIDDLRNCMPGKCGVKLSPQMIKALSEDPAFASANSGDIAGAYKQMIIDYVAGYIARGDKALIDYDAPRKPVRLVDEYSAIYGMPNLPDFLTPEFGKYLRTYPEKLEGVEDRFDWAVVETGLRPIFSVTHSSAYTKGTTDGDVFMLATKQIYASHYIDATLAVFTLVISNSSEKPTGYLIFSNTSRSTALAGVFGGVVHMVAEGQADERVRELLVRAKARLEAKTPLGERPSVDDSPGSDMPLFDKLAENWTVTVIAALLVAAAAYFLLLRRRS